MYSVERGESECRESYCEKTLEKANGIRSKISKHIPGCGPGARVGPAKLKKQYLYDDNFQCKCRFLLFWGNLRHFNC